MGFEVSVIKTREVKLSNREVVRVSSTVIRKLLGNGRVADAAVALSRAYRLIGQVIPGRGKGKQLGFPTANMEPPPQLVPAEGVYAGFVEIADSFEQLLAQNDRIPAALSIGRSESLGSGNPLLIEAHILTNDIGGLKDKWLAIDFVDRIRDQIKFDNDRELTAQIAKDCEKAKEILTTEVNK